jgi:hypothetical protein
VGVVSVNFLFQLSSQIEITYTELACYLPHVGFFLGLFFDPEDGDDVFLDQNNG